MDFPCDRLFDTRRSDGTRPFRSERLMARNVRWFFKAKTKDLRKFRPNDIYCNWLMESVPLFLKDVTEKDGLKHLRSAEFLHVSGST